MHLLRLAFFGCALGAVLAAFGAAKPKPFYTKTADAVKAAKAAERPILIYFAPKDTKIDADFSNRVLKNKVFMGEVVGKNFVLLKVVPKMKLVGNAQEILNLPTNDLASVNLGFQGTDKMWGYGFAILDSEAKTALARGGYAGLAQPKADLPLNTWIETLIAACESKKIPFEVSPALRKYLDNPPQEKKDRKGK